MTRLATLREGGADGTLVVVSADHERFAAAPAPTLQRALEEWDQHLATFAAIEARLERGEGESLDASRLHAPLPRAYQWCEGSTYLSHMERCRKARGAALPPGHGKDPAVLQSGSDRFLAPTEPIVLRDEAWGLDCESTIAVIVAAVPEGVSVADAASYIRLVVLANDLTLRTLLQVEFDKGVGFFQSKPLRPLAPIAVSPDSLGAAWDGTLLHATLETWINGERIGAPDTGADAAFDFAEVIAHAARTRPLATGTLVATGTVSNRDASRGFSCIAERRAYEILEGGEATTPYLKVGDTIRIEAFDGSGRSVFGAMDTTVAPAPT